MTAATPRRWMVIGASGFVGSTLTNYFRGQGRTVVTLTSPRLLGDPLADAKDLVAQAATRPEVEALAREMADVECVFLAAGLATPDSALTDELIGANSLLPVLVGKAADLAGVRRFAHISSASVQGRRAALTEGHDVNPFSAYSRSKALGELALDYAANRLTTEVVIIRATSVQGFGRHTTSSLRRVARSSLASVAGTGDGPSAVSSAQGLAEFGLAVGDSVVRVPRIVLQPWEGMSAAEVLTVAGARPPRHLPRWLCRAAVAGSYRASSCLAGRFHGAVRRIEAMWFGQEVDAAWARSIAFRVSGNLELVLSTDGQREGCDA